MATPAAAKVIAEALALSDEDRAAVAEELLASLNPAHDDSPEAVAAFKAELDRRWAAYQSGSDLVLRAAAQLGPRIHDGQLAWRGDGGFSSSQILRMHRRSIRER